MNLHPNFSYQVDYVGNEQSPVLIVDHFLSEPDSLIDYCVENSQFNSLDKFYPGVRSPAPNLYVQILYHHLHKIIYDIFSLKEGMVKTVKSDFSMVVSDPFQLSINQRVPHFDSVNEHDLAAVHYLCGSAFGGTSLYRHRATGYESVTDARLPRYSAILKEELSVGEYPKAYMNGDNDFFERVKSYEAEYNRIIVYPCKCLHSGNISSDFSFEKNPRKGRLTLNTFIGV